MKQLVLTFLLMAVGSISLAQIAGAQELAKDTVVAEDYGREMAAAATPSGKAVLEAYVTAWNKHDFAALDKLLAPDAIHEDIAWPSREQGPSKIKEFMRGMIEAEPDLEWRLTKVVEGEPTVAAEWTWTATYTGDTPIGPVVKRRISGRGASVAVIENGRIKHFSDYYDMASFFPKAAAESGSTGKTDPPPHGAAVDSSALEAKVRKAWEDFKNKNKAGFSAELSEGFREVEEDGEGLRDAKAEVAEIDQFDIARYSLKDFVVKPIGADDALVTYLAEYHGSVAGQAADAKSIFGEVWTKDGNGWKLLYVQETKVK